ncbi:hypothetical protein LCGC14_2091100 [marine sediment metagenome]|uniref:HNH nuclease domain-containing protein n=1 Tax=marine sediment metagenome TaxID=412755 RepID=A0A0F9ECZ8_9ZZZZ
MLAIDNRVRSEPVSFEITENLLQRFWKKVDKSDDCWNWQASTRMGYGAFKIDGAVWEAHRLVWLFQHGGIAAGNYVCHICDNRRCVRPDHLFLGTAKDNHADMVQKGRQIIIRGEEQGNTVLSNAIVREIWRIRRSMGWGSRRIGRVLDVSHAAVEAVLSGRSWKHVR